MQFFLKLLTARVALVVAIEAILKFVKDMNPSLGLDPATIGHAIDALMIALAGVFVSQAQHAEPPKNVGKKSMVAIVLAALFCIPFASGCAGFLRFKDPQAQAVACTVTEALMGPIHALAAMLGFPVAIVEALYAEGCELAASQGLEQAEAEKAGLEHAKRVGVRMKSMGVSFNREAAQ